MTSSVTSFRRSLSSHTESNIRKNSLLAGFSKRVTMFVRLFPRSHPKSTVVKLFSG